MAFLDNFYLIVLESQFEKGNYVVCHELYGDSTAPHARKFLLDESNILGRLNYSDLIFTALSLDRNNVMAAVLIEPNIKLIDLDLPDPDLPPENWSRMIERVRLI
ncbi:MAG: hypothetical protein O2995_06115 [Proteobacteria bacterium]|nr:hypothetical protein [Pseudomonadota bacterium]